VWRCGEPEPPAADSREAVEADKVTVESSTEISLGAPFEAAGPAVLYLKKVGY